MLHTCLLRAGFSILWITFLLVYKLNVLPLSLLQTVLKALLSMVINKTL